MPHPRFIACFVVSQSTYQNRFKGLSFSSKYSSKGLWNHTQSLHPWSNQNSYLQSVTCNPFSPSTSWDPPPSRPLFACSKHLGLLWGLCISTPFQAGFLAHCLTFLNPLLRYSLPSEVCLTTLSELISYGSPQLALHAILLLRLVLITILYSLYIIIYIYIYISLSIKCMLMKFPFFCSLLNLTINKCLVTNSI